MQFVLYIIIKAKYRIKMFKDNYFVESVNQSTLCKATGENVVYLHIFR